MGKRYADMTPEQKAVHLARNRAWEKANPEKSRPAAAARLNRLRAKNPERFLLYAAKARAKAAGIEFSLSEADVSIPATCPILGIALLRSVVEREAGSPSLDRRDNSRGYVPGNVEVISWRANKLKGDAEVSELRAIADWLDRRHDRAHISDGPSAVAPHPYSGAVPPQ